jgi:hypothetical protein
LLLGLGETLSEYPPVFLTLLQGNFKFSDTTLCFQQLSFEGGLGSFTFCLLKLLSLLELRELLLQVAGSRRTSPRCVQIASELCFCCFTVLLL